MNPAKSQETEYRRYAEIGTKVAAIGSAAIGLSAPSIGKALNLAATGGVNWILVGGGAATFAAIELAKSRRTSTANNACREGIDSDVGAPEYAQFKMDIIKSTAGHATLSFIESLKTYTTRTETALDTNKSKIFSRDQVNVLHALAMLGNDTSRFAQQLRKEPEYQSKLVKEIFKESDTLMKIMRPNVAELRKFAFRVQQSLGKEAPFFMKYHDDYNQGKAEWRDFFGHVQNATIENMQEANFEHHCIKHITIALRDSLKGELTPDRASKISTLLAKYNGVLAKSELGSEQYLIADLAATVSKKLRTLSRDPSQLMDFHHDPLFKNINKSHMAESLRPSFGASKLFNHMRQHLLPGVGDGTGPKPLNTVFTETLFAEMHKKAVATLRDKGYVTPEHYDKNNDPNYKEKRLRSLEVHPSRLGSVTEDDVASSLVKRVQRRVARDAVDDKAGYQTEPDTHHVVRFRR